MFQIQKSNYKSPTLVSRIQEVGIVRVLENYIVRLGLQQQ